MRAVAVGAVVLAGLGVVFAYHRLQGNIEAQNLAPLTGVRPPTESAEDPTTGQDAVNVLVMGSDTRDLSDGTGNEYGGSKVDPGARSDTTVLVHLAADRRSATLVSIPRDSEVQIPSCTTASGATTKAQRNLFNAAYSLGGPGCTIRTVQALTGVPIDHHVVVDFRGFRSMVDALGGVTICTPQAIDDTRANLHLTAGTHTDVDGETALAYARARYTIGDGSDISRIGRQQALMSSMVRKVTSSAVLTRPDELYRFLAAATSSVTTDPALANLSGIASLARSLQSMPADCVQFVTVPNEPSPGNANRVRWTPAAGSLWQQIRTDTAAPASRAPATTPATTPTSSGSAGAVVPPAAARVATDDICT